uniref:DBB domain-containing protein n=1 Tax=Esox lucius TaxID=8010 RepID=A0AAY5KII3_ESOLU
MKLNPQQAPLYGQVVITVQLCDEEQTEDEEGEEYYLLFSGSSQSHLTSAVLSSHDTLQAMCPAHDCSELVRVTLCRALPGNLSVCETLTSVLPVAEQQFSFVQDLAFDMAQFLVSTAGRPDGLEGALLLDECRIPLEECERLDESLSLALRHLDLPDGWSLLGTRLRSQAEPPSQETLLHFAARRGLGRVAAWLLLQPGAPEALRLTNRQGLTPAAAAHQRGHRHLHQLLTQAEEEAETVANTGTLQLAPGLRVACHLPRLNTYTMTVGAAPGADPASLQGLVEDLKCLIKEHPSLVQLQTESVHRRAALEDGAQSRGGGGAQGAEQRTQDTGEEKQGCGKGKHVEVQGDIGPCHAPQTSARPPDNISVENWACPVTLHTPRDYSRAECEEGDVRREEAAGVTDCAGCEGQQSRHEDRGACSEGSGIEGNRISVTQRAVDGTEPHVQEAGSEEGQGEKDDGQRDPSALSGDAETSTVAAMGHTQSPGKPAAPDYPDNQGKWGLLGEDKEEDSCQDGCDTLNSEEITRTASISPGQYVSDPSPVDRGQELQEDPATPMEGLREGDTQLEKSQETAAATRKHFPPTEPGSSMDEETRFHSVDQADKEMGQYSMDSTVTEELDCGKLLNSSGGHVDRGSGDGHVDRGSGGGQVDERSDGGHVDEGSGVGQVDEGSGGGHVDEGSGVGQVDEGSGGGHVDSGSGGGQVGGPGGDQVDGGSGGGHVDGGSGGGHVDEGSGGGHVDEGSGGGHIDEGSGGSQVDEGSGGGQVDEGSGGDQVDEGSGGGQVDEGSGGGHVDEGSDGGHVDEGSGGGHVDGGSGGGHVDEGSGGGHVDGGSGGGQFDGGSVLAHEQPLFSEAQSDEEEDSFRSISSSSTEIFHMTEEESERELGGMEDVGALDNLQGREGVGAVDNLEGMEDVGAVDNLEGMEDVGAVDNLEGMEDVGAVDNLEGMEDVGAVDNLEGMEDVGAVDNLEGMEGVGAVDNLQGMEDVGAVDNLQEREDVGAVDNLEGMEDVGAVDNLEGMEDVGAVDNLEGMEDVGAVDTLQGMEDVGAVDTLQGMEDVGAVDTLQGREDVGAVDNLQGMEDVGALDTLQGREDVGAVDNLQGREDVGAVDYL